MDEHALTNFLSGKAPPIAEAAATKVFMLVVILYVPLFIHAVMKGLYPIILSGLLFILSGCLQVLQLKNKIQPNTILSVSSVYPPICLCLTLILLVYYTQPSAAFWTVPVLSGWFFLTSRSMAYAMVACTVLPLIAWFLYLGEYLFLYRYVGCIVSVIIMSNIVINTVNRLRQQLFELATTDALTGANNRRYLELCLKNHNLGETFSLLILDIDHFKQVNDIYGHQVGDQVLKDLTTISKHVMQDGDALFRMGGEEFLLVMPNTALPEAVAFADKWRKELATLCIDNTKKCITVSIGVSECNQDFTPNQWLRAADDCLYRAKNSGRNCVKAAHCKEAIKLAS